MKDSLYESPRGMTSLAAAPRKTEWPMPLLCPLRPYIYNMSPILLGSISPRFIFIILNA